MRVVALLLVVLLAGCQSPAPTDRTGDDADAPPALPETLRFDDCIHQLAFVGVPLEDATARLPEGFRPVQLAEGLARLVVLATSCSSVDNGTDGMRELFAALAVEPPTRFAREDVAFHAFYTGMRTDNLVVGAHYAAWGIPGGTGSVTVDVQIGQAGSGTTLAGEARLTTAAGGMPQEGPAGAVRLFTDQGDAIMAVDFDFTSYRMVLGGARFEDPEGLAGFGSLDAAGYAVHEWGDPYGFVLRRIAF